MSNFFTTKKPEIQTEFKQPEDFSGVTKAQADFLKSRIGQPGKAFEGERVADLTSLQQTGLESLKQFAGQKAPETFGLAESEFVRQLSPTDPENTILFKAVREGAKRNLQQSIEQISDFAGGTGRAFSGARLEQEGKAAEGATIGLNQILGEIALEQERQRITAAKELPQLSEFISRFPARQAETVLGLGDIERQIEQSKKDVDFQEFIRRFETTPMNIAQLANQFVGIKPPETFTTQTPGDPSGFTKTLNFLGDLAIAAVSKGGGQRNPDQPKNIGVVQGGEAKPTENKLSGETFKFPTIKLN